MPVNPLAAAALVALCLALPFGVAALFDDGAQPRPVAVETRGFKPLSNKRRGDVRISTLDRAPRLPALRSSPDDDPPGAAAATAPTADPAPAAGPAGGDQGSGSSGASGTSDSSDPTR